MQQIGSWVPRLNAEIFGRCPVIDVSAASEPPPGSGIHVLVGGVGSGKSTIAKSLCARNAALLYGGDLGQMGTDQVDALLLAARTSCVVVELQTIAKSEAIAAKEVRVCLDRGRMKVDMPISMVGVAGIEAA